MQENRQRKGEPAERRIIRKRVVLQRTGYSDATIWRKEKAGQFPERVQLSPDGMAVGWYEDEVDEWIRSRIRGPGKQPASAKRARPEERDASTKPTDGAHASTAGPTNASAAARGIAAAALKRGRGARSGDRAG